jgi:integrase
MIDWADAVFGKERVCDLDTYVLQRALDPFEDRPGLQLAALTIIQAVQKWAIKRRRMPHKITDGIELVKSEGRREPWTDAEIALARQHVTPQLSRAILLMAHTGQRRSDVVKMRWSDFEDYHDNESGMDFAGINVIQQKTGKRLWVPFTPELAAALEIWKAENAARAIPSLFVLAAPNGGPYTPAHLTWHWNHQRDTNPNLRPLKEAGRVLHGLRSYRVVTLRKLGKSALLISNMVGMSEQMVKRYSDKADQQELAVAAMRHDNVRTFPERKQSDKQGG